MLPKLGWDAVLNHYGTTLVLIQNRLGDFEFLKSVQPEIDRIYALNLRMQQLFRDWHQLEHPEWTEAQVARELLRLAFLPAPLPVGF